MLRPQKNNYREIYDITGLWKFKADPEKIGENEKWYQNNNFSTDIAVPGSWNEQLEAEGMIHYVGTAWYSHQFFIPENYADKKIWIRFDSVDYFSKLWINGELIGENNGGFLPFDFEITKYLKLGSKNKLTLLVNNELSCDTIPQGITQKEYAEEGRLREETFPGARFDFSPYGGIHRPVKIYTTPKQFVTDIKIDTEILSSDRGKVKIEVSLSDGTADTLNIQMLGKDDAAVKSFAVSNNAVKAEFEIENCEFWCCENPFLYELQLELLENNSIVDSYETKFGVREIKVEGTKLLLNNKEVFLKGYGKHEDFQVLGKALNMAVLVKDFSLMKWTNANSFRTSHYPYAEEWLDYADENGFLVIDEVPAVSLDFRRTTEKTLEHHKEFLRKLITRDKNHPCVIMWATGNEPNIVAEPSYYNGSGEKYWKEIYEYTKSMDPRPITVPNCQRAGRNDPAFTYSDVLSLNRYFGWYENPGKLDEAIARMDDEMDAIAGLYGKPMIITEFGADTMAGFHSVGDQMFTEEYQSNLLERYCRLIESKDYTCGEHVWNFADFKTPQHVKRVVNNLKGVFTRTRDPKLAAFTLKKIWGEK
ncbi:MAG: beta-glucuronidase [Rhodothermaceae bacterium]